MLKAGQETVIGRRLTPCRKVVSLNHNVRGLAVGILEQDSPNGYLDLLINKIHFKINSMLCHFRK